VRITFGGPDVGDMPASALEYLPNLKMIEGRLVRHAEDTEEMVEMAVEVTHKWLLKGPGLEAVECFVRL